MSGLCVERRAGEGGGGMGTMSSGVQRREGGVRAVRGLRAAA